MHLATAVVAAAARPVADMLGTLGFRAKESHVLDRTIAAAAAAEKHGLRHILHHPQHQMPGLSLIQLSRHEAQYTRQRAVESEQDVVAALESLVSGTLQSL
jgi:hypothetical protein